MAINDVLHMITPLRFHRHHFNREMSHILILLVEHENEQILSFDVCLPTNSNIYRLESIVLYTICIDRLLKNHCEGENEQLKIFRTFNLVFGFHP